MSENLNNNFTHYSRWEPLIDGGTFLGTGVGICALRGVSLINPIGIGILVASGINALSSSLFSKFIQGDGTTIQFFKLCAQITLIALLSIALPYLNAALGVHAFFVLTYEVAVSLGIFTIATKVATFGAYTIGSWVRSCCSSQKTKLKEVNHPLPSKTESDSPKNELSLDKSSNVEKPLKKETPTQLDQPMQLFPIIGKNREAILNLPYECTNYLYEQFKTLQSKSSPLLGRMSKNINWKTVGTVSLIGLILLTPFTAPLVSTLFAKEGGENHPLSTIPLSNLSTNALSHDNETTLPPFILQPPPFAAVPPPIQRMSEQTSYPFIEGNFSSFNNETFPLPKQNPLVEKKITKIIPDKRWRLEDEGG
jgi:hypothetical protein